MELDDSKATLLQLDVDKSYNSKFEPKMIVSEITLYALLGSLSLGTMRIKGKINGYWLIILIDTGSTHKCVDVTMVFVLQLPLDFFVAFKVKVANGASIRKQGVCFNVKVTMQGQVFVVDLNALDWVTMNWS